MAYYGAKPRTVTCRLCGCGDIELHRYLDYRYVCTTCRPVRPPARPPKAPPVASTASVVQRTRTTPYTLPDPLDKPRGGMRPTPRACSRCKQLTIVTTPRGRSVHPCCEGWLESLTVDALAELTWTLVELFGVTEVTEV